MPVREKREALEFARGINYVLLATSLDDQPYVRLMHWSGIEDDFTIWLSTRVNSNKVRHIENNPAVCAIFVHEVGYLRVFGKAEVVNDKKKKVELWEDQWDIFWPRGADDPDYRLIKITAESVDYLNMSKGNTVAQLVNLSD